MLGIDDVYAAGAQDRDVLDDRRVLPHFGVHRRAQHHGRTRRQQDIGQQVGRQPDSIGRDQARRRRRDQDQVSCLAQLRVRDRSVRVVPESSPDRLAGERRERGGAEEPLGPIGHHRHHMCAGVDETPADLDGLVGSDPPGDAEHDPLASKHRRLSRRRRRQRRRPRADPSRRSLAGPEAAPGRSCRPRSPRRRC